jgi:hypothetical protein
VAVLAGGLWDAVIGLTVIGAVVAGAGGAVVVIGVVVTRQLEVRGVVALLIAAQLDLDVGVLVHLLAFMFIELLVVYKYLRLLLDEGLEKFLIIRDVLHAVKVSRGPELEAETAAVCLLGALEVPVLAAFHTSCELKERAVHVAPLFQAPVLHVPKHAAFAALVDEGGVAVADLVAGLVTAEAELFKAVEAGVALLAAEQTSFTFALVLTVPRVVADFLAVVASN